VRGFLVRQEPARIYQQCGYLLERLAEQGCETDTPCQSAYKAAFSAAGIEVAVSVTAEVNDERCAIIAPKLLLKRSAVPEDIQLVPRLRLIRV